MHRSPGGVTCEASFPARARRGLYPRAMRRWVCIVALLAGFTADDYVRGVRLRQPVAIERLLDPRDGTARGATRGLMPAAAWWSRFGG